LGGTSDKSHLGPYRALVSSVVLIYTLFIILSTLRLSPALCVIAGVSSAMGYVAVLVITLHFAPNSNNRHIMPDRTYVMNAILLCGSGVLAAAVAGQIRRHVVAALAEAETRRKLDRMEDNLRIARDIQTGLLPKHAPNIPGYDVAGFSKPADQTGGDFYDWFELPEGRVMFTIADATGHGIGPAILVTACRAYFRALASHNDPLECITAQVDALIAADVPDGRFITAAIALLDPHHNRLSVYSAGQGPLFLYRAAADCVEKIDADQPPLGISAFSGDSRARIIDLEPGDMLALVTDGFFECGNPAGELLGTTKLSESIQSHQVLASAEIISRLHQEVIEFCQGTPQADDMTAVVIKRQRA
jgi:serine phosphatase RsbU (regulator of sigma subunit)